jgi:hypothetical protein
MTKEKTEQETHSIDTEQQQNKKLLRLMTGYNQPANFPRCGKVIAELKETVPQTR